ncbi:MAG: hypothetical protein K2P20_04235 [Oscillospiraceae bacterium]|nr:hypothetical protein [Oscillospiraceae bacterium]
MKEYEIIKQVYSPCAPDTQEFLELELEDPETYVRGLFQNDASAEFNVTEKDGSTIVEVVCQAGQKHRYTFNKI